MNATLVATFLRQRASSPMRLLIAVAFGLFAVGAAAAFRGLQVLESMGGPLALLVTAGAIGQDVASGVLQLSLSRPVTRSEYVLSRWVAGGLGASALFAMMLAASCAMVLARGGDLSAGPVLELAVRNVAAAFGLAAVIVALSSLAPGLGDLALWFLGGASATIAQNLGTFRRWTWLEIAGHELERTLSPSLPVAWMHGGAVGWAELAAYASTVVLALAVAVLVMNRKELSYASG